MLSALQKRKLKVCQTAAVDVGSRLPPHPPATSEAAQLYATLVKMGKREEGRPPGEAAMTLWSVVLNDEAGRDRCRRKEGRKEERRTRFEYIPR